MVGGGGQDPNDYIRSGLIFHLDGADFDGDTWTDRVAHITYAKEGTNITKIESGVYFSGEENNYLYSTSKVDAPYNNSTIEIVYRSLKTDWGVIYTTNNLSHLMYCLGNGRVSYYPGANRATKATGSITSIYTHSVSHTHNYFNGVSMGTADKSSWRNPAQYASVIGAIKRNNYGAEYRAKGYLYQIRIYNRILTEAEILHNANIDAQKYNITL